MELKVSQISKDYTQVKAVNQLSFEVKSGEIFALLGPNGAGKSSTIRMLIGLTAPDTGQIRFKDGTQSFEKLTFEQFGYLPEERGLFQEKSLLATLLYFGRLKGLSKSDARQKAEYWLAQFDLLERKNDSLKSLSKGNQQKVQLISAIIHEPKLLILDEPFSGLDPINQEKVIGFLEQLKAQGMTILLSAHQMSLVEKLADRFLLMNQGQALLYGTLQDIRRASALGDQLIVGFKTPVLATALAQLAGVSKVEQTDATKLTVSLQPDGDVPSLLQIVMQDYQVVSVHTQQADLHQIYLSSLSEQGE